MLLAAVARFLLHLLGRQRKQLLDHRFLLHGVDEAGVGDVDRVQLALLVLVEQHLDGADQLFEVRRVAQLRGLRHHLGADARQKAKPLVADGHRLRLHALALQLTQLGGDGAQHVGVHAAAQALVRGHHDQAGFLDVVRLHEGVHVLGVGRAEVGGDVAHLLGVGTGRAHAILRLAHLGRGHHLHGLGDLLGVFHRFDLAANFLADCHCLSSFQ